MSETWSGEELQDLEEPREFREEPEERDERDERDEGRKGTGHAGRIIDHRRGARHPALRLMAIGSGPERRRSRAPARHTLAEGSEAG